MGSEPVQHVQLEPVQQEPVQHVSSNDPASATRQFTYQPVQYLGLLCTRYVRCALQDGRLYTNACARCTTNAAR